MKNSFEPEGWREDLQRLRALEYIPKTHIDFFEYISNAHYQAKDRLAKDKIYPSLSLERSREMLSQGFPLINFNRINIKTDLLRDHLKEICTIIGKYEESKVTGRGRIEAFTGSQEYESLDLKEFIQKTLFQDSDYLQKISEKTGIDECTLEFIVLTLARPLFELAASDLKTMLAEYPWWQPFCPACGGAPFMARIRREDGMRLFRCSLCSVEWKFTRVKCPFCGSEEQKSLKFFYYHEASPYRLYVCDQCKRSIKCVDEKKIDQTRVINLAVEDVATLYFDTLAREKEYLPPSFIHQDISRASVTGEEKGAVIDL